ncbi:RAD51-associated protein 1 isoform X3 [Scophthalmus maximus]|uniref:RAD51-associated protein 1 isoform X3 n=1 Tax=Scophthalmus maximus TaxID=52904 RepID=UPI0015E09B62|nr:RAD51-associated protein 1 isoform X3 [Scophthalmus maximus]
MQTMERPSRKTKTVDYREPSVFDDDEDFACAKAPPSKKAREDVKQQQEHKKSSGKSSSQETNSQSALSQKSRRPLDVKLLERDLEAAITLSLLNNAEEIKDQSPTMRGDIKVQLPVDENTDPSSLLLSNCSVDGAILGLDEITSVKGSPAPSRQREAATEEQSGNLKEDDEDYQPKLTPGSESDEDFSDPEESEDEEFTMKKVSKIKKKEKVTKKEKTKSPPAAKKENKQSKAKSVAAASTPGRSPPAAKPAPKRPALSSAGSTPKPAVPLSPAGGRIPKWNPPGQIGKSPTSSQNSGMKSPGQGLRLGLSRHVRVKPLHPGVASH